MTKYAQLENIVKYNGFYYDIHMYVHMHTHICIFTHTHICHFGDAYLSPSTIVPSGSQSCIDYFLHYCFLEELWLGVVS